MPCPHCRSTPTSKRMRRTTLGYRRFRCRTCGRRFNERTGTPFNDLQYPTDLVLLAVQWRLQYKLSFRDVAELLLQRGYEVTHETVRTWEFRFAPLLADQLRAMRRGRAGVSWYIDETYVKVAGRWCYLYRAIDRDGDLLDSHTQRAPRQARRATLPAAAGRGGRPQAAASPPMPIRRTAGRSAGSWGGRVRHRCNRYLNNLTEQSHRALKQRYYPMLGFGSFASAAQFCAAFDELRQYFRVRQRGAEWVPLATQRWLFLQRRRSLIAEMQAA